MYALVVRFDIRDESGADEFDGLTEESVALIKELEPGTLLYVTHRVEGAPLSRVFYELYRDVEAFQAHNAAEHVVSFHARKDPLVASHRVEFLDPSYAKGLDS